MKPIKFSQVRLSNSNTIKRERPAIPTIITNNLIAQIPPTAPIPNPIHKKINHIHTNTMIIKITRVHNTKINPLDIPIIGI